MRRQRSLDFSEPRAFAPPAHVAYVGKIEHSGGLLLTHANDGPKVRQFFRIQPAGLSVFHFRRQFLQHLDVAAALERLRGHDGLATGTVQRILQFEHAVSRVNVDQDRSDARGGELGQAPLVTVRRPDADAVTGFDAQRQHAGSQPLDSFGVLGVAPADTLVAHDECIVFGKPLDGFRQALADGFLDQGRRFTAFETAECQRFVHFSRPSNGTYGFAGHYRTTSRDMP